MADISDIRKGLTIEYEGGIYTILDFQHVKQAMTHGFMWVKMKNLETGAVLERNFKPGAKIDIVKVDEKPGQFLYHDGDSYTFMELDNYEQITLPEKKIEEEIRFLKEGMEVSILFAEEKIIGIKLPNFVVLEVKNTDPGIRGDTAQGGTKPAELETGTVIQVPLFVQIGDKVRVDTRTGEYIERVKEK
uniref:Elongation factor P n=1 Tax=candidate division WOR-3 bacterium TaxID=2052148 RepID=A0A7C4U7J5_UNCW3